MTLHATEAGPRSGTGGEGMAIVTLDGVSKTYPNGTNALAEVDLDVAEGEFLSLLGPSGCGKSTALRLIAGLSPATAGRIGFPASAGARPEIGFVFQEPTLMPWASVRDNVSLPLRLNHAPAREIGPAVDEALAQVGLADFAGAYPRELSGGMKMRVSIARTLVTRPRLLLLDEPFAALDEITRFRLNNDLLSLRERHGWTVVFVTHSVFESVYLSSRIAIMAARPGRIVADIDIPVPFPRDETFRTSPEYGEICRDVSSELHRAMGAGSERERTP